MRFHILGVPHTITRPEYSTCAFTQKVLKLSKMLADRGHDVIHYGNEASVVAAEHVTVTTLDDLDRSYPGHDWRTQGFPAFNASNDPIYREFYANTISAIHRRRRRGDFLLCPFGWAHKPVADALPDMIVVEPGIGYPSGSFAPFRVFESYAVMHVYQGQSALDGSVAPRWYDAVIPNFFDPEDFTFQADKGLSYLFLGRIGPGKGINIALQTVEAVGGHLIVAGTGKVQEGQTRTDRPLRDWVHEVGVVGPDVRRKLLSEARAVICPSMYLEPFCGVQIEAMMSGTPVISTDWGAFAEYNLHGVTGYRCRTFEQFTWAARNIERIDPLKCRQWAYDNFSLERVADQYEEYFRMVTDVHSGNGWYQDRPDRTDLNWLHQFRPEVRHG